MNWLKLLRSQKLVYANEEYLEMKDTPPRDQRWWGTSEFSVGNAKRWEIGPLTLWVKRLAQEWWLACERDEAMQQRPVSMVDCDDASWLSHSSLERYVTHHAQERLHMTPMLADRPVVTRPLIPLHLCAGEEATLFVSLSVWILLEAGSQKLLIKELPIQRLSDTWFGTSTLEGELCYASTTHCRMDLEEVSPYVYRAITPVRIKNRSNETLVIERLNLPVHYLAMYGTGDNRLWTSGVSLNWEQGATVAMQIETKPPLQAKGADLLCKARHAPDTGGVMRAVTSLFG